MRNYENKKDSQKVSLNPNWGLFHSFNQIKKVLIKTQLEYETDSL